MQNSAPLRFTTGVISRVISLVTPMIRPAQPPDLNLVDSPFWSEVQGKVYRQQPEKSSTSIE